MNTAIMKVKGMILGLGIGLSGGLCATASADVSFSHSDLTSGQSAAQLDFLDGDLTVDVTSIGGAFAAKTVQGVPAMGISGGNVHGEIDGQEQMIISFSQPVHITEIEIAHLYTAGNFGDVWNETALFSTDLGDFFLEATAGESGDWTGFGELTNMSPGEQGNGGAWRVSGEDIFGGAISTLVLQSGNAGNHHKFGDFGFVHVSAAQLPAPGALAMILTGALIGRTRRRGS